MVSSVKQLGFHKFYISYSFQQLSCEIKWNRKRYKLSTAYLRMKKAHMGSKSYQEG